LAQEQPLVVRMAGVVEDELAPAARGGSRGRARLDTACRATEGNEARVDEEDKVARGDAAELRHYGREGTGVGGRVPQASQAIPAVVGSHDEREAAERAGRLRGR